MGFLERSEHYSNSLKISKFANYILQIKPLSEEELKKENIKTFYTKQDIEELRLLKEII